MSKARLDAIVKARFEVSWGKARGWIETGKVFVDGAPVTDPGAPVDATAALELKMSAPRPRAGGRVGTLTREQVIHLDSQLILVDKPAGLSTVAFENERDTLEERVNAFLGQKRVEIVHRLDRDTSGLLVFARTREAARALANQFRFHTIQRRYFALAHGKVAGGTIRSELLEDRGDGLRGSRAPGSPISREGARPAVTHVRLLSYFNGMSLIECVLETGRTHQIRIHLSEAGHPLVGERAYIREFQGPRIAAPRIMLHAAELGFVHPTQAAPMRWRVPPPGDFQGMLDAEAARIVS
ncbi:MAG: RluA family pseudouridine synthase [Oligoflexia bacterium]|nr:RluA family pseudouridine synthase [Oligoflexia bacterium]